MSINEIETYCPTSRLDWREWLMANHEEKQAVWLICYKKHTNIPSVIWSEAVDEAICFGWIDSVRRPIDHEKFMQFFGKRKPKSGWSRINKDKVERLIAEGLMAEAGYAAIELARQNGSWSLLDEAESLEVPPDLKKTLKAHKGADQYFNGLSKSVRKAILQWIILAKRPETRQKRIDEVAELASQQLRPKQFR